MALNPRAADSTDPEAIPTAFVQRPNGVIAYIDGEWAWSAEQLARFPRREFISVTGLSSAMAHARWSDVERGDARPGDVPRLWADREAAGFDDYGVYCDRSTIGPVLEATGERQPWWWIATLDNHPWTPNMLAAAVLEDYGVLIHPARIVWIQNQPMGHYDVSKGFGPIAWSHATITPTGGTTDD